MEITVRKANRVVTVNENEVAKYTAIGYDIVDNKGNVVQASVPHDPNVLRKAFIDNQEIIKEYKATIEQLKQRISALEAEISSSKVEADKTIKSTTKQRNKRNSD